MNTVKHSLAIGFIFTTFVLAQAQKLPNKQQISVRAPSSIKIDGKTGEWNNTFQAYNSSTAVFYTISNDEKNLYLTIKAVDRATICKIINGGITFAINTSDKKNGNEISVTYPIFENNGKPLLNISKAFFEQLSSNIRVPDSVVVMNNTRLDERSKLIMVTGIKGLDTLISVYNEDKIKVAEKFDNKMAYTYELSIALDYIPFSIKGHVLFNYHIVLNGLSIFPKQTSNPPNKIQLSVDDVTSMKLALEAQATATTDFWGEYTLAKK